MIAQPPPVLNDAQKAQRELARRELARQYLIDFACYVDPGAVRKDGQDTFVHNRYRSPHLEYAARVFEQALDGTLWQNVPGTGKKVLIITMPPGHWKSSLFSRKAPAFVVGHQKRLGKPYQVIMGSYNAALAEGNNAKVLELLESPLYQNLFPEIKLSDKERSNEKWSLAGDAFTTCKAAGVGGGLTGYHAMVAFVDDPIKSRADATSQAFISRLWDWWVDELRTRLIFDASFIFGIWTRWSEQDPAGKLAKEKAEGRNDDKLVIIRLPALAETPEERQSAAKLGLPVDEADLLGREPNEALWPEAESAEQHLATRKSYPLTFDSLYQGRPRPAGGYVVSEANFKILPTMPEKNVRWLWATDFALTEAQAANPKKDGPDYTAVGLLGLWTPDGKDNIRLVLAYLKRARLEIFDAINMVEEVVQTVERPYPIVNGQANFEKVVLGIMRRRATFLRHSIKNITRKQLPGDKLAQAQPWLEIAHAGNFYVVQGPWNNDFFAEVENFPNGANDDQAEVVSVGTAAHGVAAVTRSVSSKKMNFYA